MLSDPSPKWLSACVLLALFGASTASAEASDSQVGALRDQVSALSQRLAELEAGESSAASGAADVLDSMSWAQRIKLKGDLRYRHEMIDEAGREERTRHRIRARVGIEAKATDEISVGVQLATGGNAPTSTNQTLGSGASTKPVGVDLAYFKWAFSDTTALSGGKFKNPFYRPAKSSLIWDGDLNPEGLALQTDHGSWFASLAGLWIEERSSASDSFLVGGQAGFRFKLPNGMKLTAGASYFDVGSAQGQEPFFNGKALGNSVDANGNYLFDFQEVELFASLSTNVADRPLVFFVDYVNNTAADAFDTGWAAGFGWGAAKDSGQWKLGYAYKSLEADAVLATWSDSDFGGGGTDGTGHIFSGAYGLNKKASLKFTYFANERGADAGNERDYDRLQLDFSVKY